MQQFYNIFIWLMAMSLFNACTTEVPNMQIDNNEQHVCRMIFNASKQGFDEGNTRASETVWTEGDCVYMTFLNGTERIKGKAVYNAADDYWTLYYNGYLPLNATSTCHAYYFSGDNEEKGDKIEVTLTTNVYCDNYGTYNRTSDVVFVSASLAPLSGRIRFIGDKGKIFRITGVKSMKAYNRNTDNIESEESAILTTISDDGSTPYLYLSFASPSRTLYVHYDSFTFSTECDHPILDGGQSGYMTLPTKEKHNGWNMIERAIPTLDNTRVSDIQPNSVALASTVISNGNCTLTDCGFCYSKTPLPTINDTKASCDVKNGDFCYTLTGLTVNTVYYVRSYAVNEMGVGYGKEVSFTTPFDDILLQTANATDITYSSATIECGMLANGGNTIVERGLCWSTAASPTTSDNCLKTQTTGNTWQLTISGLKDNTKIYVRAYAIAETGIVYYGNEVSFKTKEKEVSIDRDEYGGDNNWD